MKESERELDLKSSEIQGSSSPTETAVSSERNICSLYEDGTNMIGEGWHILFANWGLTCQFEEQISLQVEM